MLFSSLTSRELWVKIVLDPIFAWTIDVVTLSITDVNLMAMSPVCPL
ncbi:hypothetical protein [Legionella sainthelensi]|nr:hypothetical protein [Legionella sainthelensi]